ncbi:MAG: AMP-binding protein, partial [Halieaceae bacterium]|nr:AMP-binding protein [Halieaceae bacterium]
MTDVFAPAPPAVVRQNPIRSGEDWQAMREACERDAGAFHGDIAARTIHWFHPELNAWLSQGQDDSWSGWSGDAAKSTELSNWVPWQQALDESAAPFFRWFVGAKTNAAFNEVDRHVLSGYGEEAAFFYEGDRWDPASNKGRGGPVQHSRLSRRELLVQSVVAAQALTDLGLSCGDCIAINMPNILEQIIWTEAAKRIGVIYTPVFGGFSDKTLSDRIENAGARVVITADGASRNAEVAGFKEIYTDPALDRYISVATALKILAEAPIGSNGDSETKSMILEHVRENLGGEITLTRAEIMREVGQVLARANLGTTQTS